MASAKKLPSGKWRCLAYIGKDEDGKRKYKSFTASSRKEAEFLAANYLANSQPDESSMTIGAAVAAYIASKENILSPSTLHAYRSIEKMRIPPIADIKITDFSTAAFQIYINNLSADLSPKTVANIHGLIVSAIKQAEPDKHLTVQLPKRKRVFRDLPEPEDVIAAIKGTDIELPVLLALWLSLRMSEVRGLRYKDISGNTLTVQRALLTVNGVSVERDTNKTYNSTRQIRLPVYLKKAIGKGESEEYIVKLSAMQIYTRLRKYLQQAGVQPIRFHDLRHLFASVMHQIGVPDKYVMEEGGWSTDYVLKNNYQHTMSAGQLRAIAKRDEYFENATRNATRQAANDRMQ